MPSDRPLLTAPLDEDTHDAWRQFARRHGVPVSALIEALGRALVLEGRPPTWQQQAVQAAREIAHERRDRRPSE